MEALQIRIISYFQHDFQLNAAKLQNDFGNLDINYLNNDSLNINVKFSLFLSSLDKLANEHSPEQKLSKNDIKLKTKPWVNIKIPKKDAFKRHIIQEA